MYYIKNSFSFNDCSFFIHSLSQLGSPDDPKNVHGHSTQHQGYHSNMHPASMVGMPSSFNPNLLAKPVPMRRLSEKRIAQARASLGGGGAESPGLVDIDPGKCVILTFCSFLNVLWMCHNILLKV